MPMYDFECRHGHKFERVVPIAERDNEIPCEGKVEQLCAKDDEGAHETTIPEATFSVWTRPVPCVLKAKRVEISHSHPGTLLDYGLGRNRDLAREGRYTGVPSTRGVRKTQI